MTSFRVAPIDFEEILKVWQVHLWPNRVSPIEPVSWIDQNGSIEMTMELGIPLFVGCFDVSSNVCGVLSGFRTSKTHFRSRGLWVAPAFRGRGLGRVLVEYIVNHAAEQKCKTIWTMPRVVSWGFYSRVGFKKMKELTDYEGGPHYIASRYV